MKSILETARLMKIPCGIHIVNPNSHELKTKVSEGYKFIAYSIDSVFLAKSSKNPSISEASS
jgi:2-dehydro-3-deoxyglucarate aldolase